VLSLVAVAVAPAGARGADWVGLGSGAKTDNMTASQSTSAETNPPRFDALSAAVEVVSVQIGGNDIGFTEMLENCVTYNPFGKPCQNRCGTGSGDQINARIAAAAPKVAAVLAGIKSHAPAARVLVVNYAAICPRPAAAAGRRSPSPTPTCPTCATSSAG
jgi:hypothetical protein